ncbi:hypothetical protein WJX73_003048 [Symbiochloris irregularis]|uniref:Uncharacterized protein n=1 Tax=Symbiochloris irregularis TaxID=706552 RepID=A0AAW1P109_9CHLO
MNRVLADVKTVRKPLLGHATFSQNLPGPLLGVCIDIPGTTLFLMNNALAAMNMTADEAFRLGLEDHNMRTPSSKNLCCVNIESCVPSSINTLELIIMPNSSTACGSRTQSSDIT